MSRRWLLTPGFMLLLLGLSGCNQSIDEQMASGLQQAETIFAAEPETSTDSIGNVQLFLPSKYTIEDSTDQYNLIISKGKQSFILFVNDREEADSRLYYNLLKDNESEKIIEEDTYEKNGIFRFSAVLKTANKDELELIVSSGGIKMTTISPAKNIEENLHEMTKIVHSVKIK